MGSDDLETYYRSLEMVPEIRLADPLTIPRIAQMTQKTNQFNLTTRRYSDEEISRLAASDSADVIWLRLRDRFGDAGIVGVCILRYEDRRAIFDTLLLSCRVLGRGVEDAFWPIACGARRPGAVNSRSESTAPPRRTAR